MKNENGSTLVLVLLVILIFSVLGVSIMGKVVNENKLTVHSEKEMQARNLAESGLTYFEKDFEKTTQEEEMDIDKYLDEYNNKNIIGKKNSSEKAIIKEIQRKNDILEVYSQGIVDNMEVEIKGIYELKSVINERTIELADYTDKGTTGIDFSQFSIAKIRLPWLLDLDLINIKGNDDRFYRVPNDDVFGVEVLGLVGISIGNGDRFHLMENGPVIATREGSVLRAGVANDLIRVNVLDYKDEDDTNVLIDGHFVPFKLVISFSGYRDIRFQKFAVMGNAIIRRDNKSWFLDAIYDRDRRYFSFRDGLYVNRSLTIGDKNRGESELGLIGNMVAMENLNIFNTDLEVGVRNECYNPNDTNCKYPLVNPDDFNLTIHVHGDVTIEDSCFKLKDEEKNDIRILSKGSITFKDIQGSDCNEYPGFFYAEDGVIFKDEEDNVIKEQLGKTFGELDPINLEIKDNSIPMNIYRLEPLGRKLE